VFSQFTVVYTKSTAGAILPSGAAYGYVHFRPGSGIVARFNSAGGTNTVTPGAVGVWVVRMPHLGSSVQAGGVQVTAVDPSGPAKCELRAWAWSPGGQRFVVRCFNGGVTPLKTGWTLSYQRRRAITGGGLPASPKLYAYTLNNMPAIPGPYAPAPPSVNYNSAAATNTIRRRARVLRPAHAVGHGAGRAQRDSPRCRLLHSDRLGQELPVADHLYLEALISLTFWQGGRPAARPPGDRPSLTEAAGILARDAGRAGQGRCRCPGRWREPR
jgi:hypothetical protein